MQKCLHYFSHGAIIQSSKIKNNFMEIQTMKKAMIILMLVASVLAGCFAFVACNDSADANFVAVAATDLIQEDFGIAITKGNTALKEAVNQVIDEWNANGNMTKYMDYYSAVADEETSGVKAVAPEGLKVSWDFGNATETITVYTESGFAPYEFIYGNEVIGLDIAIMNQVAVNLGKKIDVQDGSFDLVATNVASATGDAVGAAGMTITDERKEKVDFSNVYSSSTLVVVSKDGQFKSVADLAGKKVGVQEGTSGDLIISAAASAAGYSYEVTNDDESVETVTIKAAGAEVKQYKQYALALQDLKNGRIDAILMDKIPAELML